MGPSKSQTNVEIVGEIVAVSAHLFSGRKLSGAEKVGFGEVEIQVWVDRGQSNQKHVRYAFPGLVHANWFVEDAPGVKCMSELGKTLEFLKVVDDSQLRLGIFDPSA